jgi:PAS domain-containing protein
MTSSHDDLMGALTDQFRPVLEQSVDGVYLWLDETHKICNEKLASMFGYTVDEWCAMEPFLESFVAEQDRSMFAWNYHNRVATFAFPATFRFNALHKDGSTFLAETDMIPIACGGRAVAYHFVRRIAG